MTPKIITYVLAATVVLVVIGVFVYWQNNQSVDSVEEFNQALEQAVVETPEVSPNVNPIKQVLPSENPIEKTNPFKNDYQNPFE